MNVMYILSGTPLNGGATKSFLAMADAVAEAGHKVSVVVPDENGVTPVLRERGWKVLVVPYVFCALPPLSARMRDILLFFPRMLKYALLNLKARKAVIRFALEEKADVIHDNTSVTDLGHYAAKDLGVPHIIHVREYGWKDFRLVLPGLKKRLQAENAFVIAITRDIALLRGKGLDPSRIKVIYNGVVKASDFSYDEDKGDYFLYAGRIEEAKGIGDLLEAYIRYAAKILGKGDTPLRLRIAGASPYPAYQTALKRKIADAGLNGYVDWLGEIDDLSREASKAVATVIPSRFEGFGRVMPEVMTAGSLCIARSSGGSAEQMANGLEMTGKEIALSFSTVEGLTDCLTEVGDAIRSAPVFEERGKYCEMIRRAQRTVESLYTRDAYSRAILALYSEIEAASRR